MEFTKKINRCGGRKGGYGALIIANGFIKIRITTSNAVLKEAGLIKGGIGVVIKKGIEGRKTKYVANKMKYDKEDIPVELQGTKYRFRIPAEKLSDTEFVFKFDKAVMLNKK